MKIRAILPIKNFSPEIDNTIPPIFGFNVFKGSQLSLLPKSELDLLKYAFGHLRIEELSKDYYLEYLGDISENNFLTGNENDEEVCIKILNNIALLFRGLWFLKDNSTYVREIFLIYPDSEYVTGRIKSEVSMNSKGRNELEKYSPADVSIAINMLDDIKKIVLKDVADHNIKPFDINKPSPNPLNLIPYVNSRMTKAITFLGLARQHSILIIKISFYIGLFECLFTNTSKGVVNTLKERIPLFLNIDQDNKPSLCESISRAYNVRSRYFHGDNYDKKIDLIDLCTKMDNLSRLILNKILSIKNNQVFTTTYNNSGNAELAEYFKQLKLASK